MRSRGRPCASRNEQNPNPFSGIEDSIANSIHSSLLNTSLNGAIASAGLNHHQLNQHHQQSSASDSSASDQQFEVTEVDDVADEQLSLAVEVAAVNHAILELSGVHGSLAASVKQEQMSSP